jgi:hypothetical protein
MPALRNARQERFAQALALGLAPREAYERAGYAPGVRAVAAAARLQSSTGLKARLAEITAGAAGAGKPRAGTHRDAGFAGAAKPIASAEVASTAPASQHAATRSQPGAGWRDAGCGVTPSAEMAAGKAASNGSRSNGSAPKKPISNGVAPDTSPSGTTARDDTAPETSPPAIVTPPEPTPGGATVAALIAEFEEARQLALEVKQPAAAVSATMSKARISGLLGEKADAKPGDGPLEMSDLEMARRMGLLLARGLRNMPGEASH